MPTRFGTRQPAVCFVDPPAQRVDQTALEGELGVALEKLGVVETREPAFDGGGATLDVSRQSNGGHDPRHVCDVSRGLRVLERRLVIPLRLVPGGGATVQNRLEPGVVLGELAPQQVPEQVVIAVPDPLAVERDEEEIRTLDLLEFERRALVPEHGVAECAAHPVEHRRPPQEPERARAEAGDVLLPQIVREVPVRVAAFGRIAPAGSRRVLAQGEGREVQTSGPALAVTDELGRLGERQLAPVA